MDISKIIDTALSFFEYKKRGEKTITILKDDAPEELRDSVREAHGDRSPDNWIFDTYHSILNSFNEYTIEDLDQLEDNRHEIVDGLVSVYTAELTAWLASDIRNVEYIDGVLEEETAENGANLLMLAQYRAIDEIMSEVINYITKQAETDNGACTLCGEDKEEAEASYCDKCFKLEEAKQQK